MRRQSKRVANLQLLLGGIEAIPTTTNLTTKIHATLTSSSSSSPSLVSNTRVVRASYANKSGVTPANFRVEHLPDSIDLNSVHTLVTINTGYEKYTRVSGLDDLDQPSDIRVLPAHARDESKGVRLSNYVSALGMNGLTAYASLKQLDVQPGKTIFVSSASGAVGQLVRQLAKKQGLHVIDSAGSDEKVAALISEQHLDGAFNYKTESTRDALQRLAPKGID
ncbi:hypothetical protein BGZ82_004305 [Podila clonocystis]|nr:hypothetical protein BGZ82_004305 [Podila clonocystis]